MKNQYVGDNGDFTKMGLLRYIMAETNLSLGVNWYLTPDDNKNDGNIKLFKNNIPDTVLYNILKNAEKNISVLESLLQGAKFHNCLLDFTNSKFNRNTRDFWHKKSLEYLKSCDIVFLDPDNGLETDNISPYSNKNGNKYVTYNEVADYFNKNNSTVIIYQHKTREPVNEYLKRILYVKNIIQINEPFEIIRVGAMQRDYFILPQPGHNLKIKKALNNMFVTSWKKYFPECGILKEDEICIKDLSGIQSLCLFIPYFKNVDPNEACKWSNLRKGEDGVISLPSPIYNKNFKDFVSAFYKSGLSVSDYNEKLEQGLSGREAMDIDDLLKSADFELVKVILTKCIRMERFFTGAWDGYIRNGVFLNILQKLSEYIN